ncbi:O-antigen ligase domain-containing protein [Crocosphaera sp. UHCC 0190]|uniref:O-antigen ligase domain-containing protein n=1 Tax=Crocosphaera sp. UHCC 0190 TaxID=3110246 RepID=UPI002B1F0C62|nr:O-antigen ligase domain-containing protein [Crocosphaera sp. UHCC 0190]MEA5509912.1 O-antigen ligase domain-containing protein [Crocosphaera sp. UHCC 0190]
MILPPQLVMLAWLPILLSIFTKFSSRRAVIISFLVAWLFLPQRASFALPGLPDYTRISATCYGILLATFLFDGQRFRSFKFGWLDVPMVIACICPFFSSMSNDLGAYDGLSATLNQIVSYGFPYFLGRIYFNDLSGLRQLAIGIFISGLIYVPLCLYEIKMSPQLHRIVYGYHSYGFVQAIRYGGFRPTVFMLHGLEVGMWMMSATLIGMWLWQGNVLEKVWNIPINWLVLTLIITLILIKSTGGYAYFAYGIIILFTAKWFRNSTALLMLIIGISLYLCLASSGNMTVQKAQPLLSTISNIAGPDRAGSLEFRLANEELLVKKALERPVFGWGGWGRNRVYDYNWEGQLVSVSVTDSLWIITYGTKGYVGLISLYASSLLPALSFFWTGYPARLWFHPKIAPAAVLSVIIVLYMLDCTLNAMFNPIFTLVSGGIAGLVMQKQKTSIRTYSQLGKIKI